MADAKGKVYAEGHPSRFQQKSGIYRKYIPSAFKPTSTVV